MTDKCKVNRRDKYFGQMSLHSKVVQIYGHTHTHTHRPIALPRPPEWSIIKQLRQQACKTHIPHHTALSNAASCNSHRPS